MMQGKKMIGLSVVSIMLLTSSSAAMGMNHKTEPVQAEPIAIKHPVKNETKVVVAKEMKSDGKLVNYNVRIPEVQGLRDAMYQEQLNYIMMSHAMKDIKSVETQAEELAAESKKEGWEFRPFEIFIDFEVKSNDDVLSYTITTYTMTGGANGITRVDSYNIDTNQNKPIELKDLFEANADYKNVINREIATQIAAQSKDKNKAYFEGADGFQTVSDLQDYYIKDDRLVIIFPEYTIAPGFMGTPEFEIPMGSLNSVLKHPEPLIVDGSYYNYHSNFAFRIPPIWENKVEIKEKYNMEDSIVKVDFIYTPQGSTQENTSLASISVVDKGEYKDIEKNDAPVYKIAETEAYVYLVSTPGANPYSADSQASKEYSKLVAALDGVDDLFKIVNVEQELENKVETEVEISTFNKLIINSREIALENPMYKTEKGVMMIPLRQVSEALGYKVTWNDKERSVELSSGAQWTSLKLGEDNYSFAKMLVKLGTAPEMRDECTYVPLDFASTILKAEVNILEDGVVTIVQN